MPAESGPAMWKLAQQLEPIYRTLVSPGFEESLRVIDRVLPLTIKRYPSGQKVFDWVIPNSWTWKEARLEDMSGSVLISTNDHPFVIGPYSIPFSGVVEREDLMRHLCTLPHLPDAVPLCPSYYERDWRLGVPHNLKESLRDEKYHVHIESEFSPGHLCIGEVLLPGDSDEEILFSTYLCHPHEANDNISGVVVSLELFKILSQMQRRRYTYRLIVIPETIGSVTYLYHHTEEINRTLGGFALTCCGDSGDLTLKKSWAGNTVMDRAAIQALKEREAGYRVLDYYISGSDERQYNAPGFRLAVPTIMRTPPAGFPEYHSSADNLDLIDPQYLMGTLRFVLDTVYIIENNVTFKNLYQTEPFLSGHGIFEQPRVGEYGVFHQTKEGLDPGLVNFAFALESDGNQDLLHICEKWKCSFFAVERSSQAFERAGLVERV